MVSWEKRDYMAPVKWTSSMNDEITIDVQEIRRATIISISIMDSS